MDAWSAGYARAAPVVAKTERVFSTTGPGAVGGADGHAPEALWPQPHPVALQPDDRHGAAPARQSRRYNPATGDVWDAPGVVAYGGYWFENEWQAKVYGPGDSPASSSHGSEQYGPSAPEFSGQEHSSFSMDDTVKIERGWSEPSRFSTGPQSAALLPGPAGVPAQEHHTEAQRPFAALPHSSGATLEYAKVPPAQSAQERRLLVESHSAMGSGAGSQSSHSADGEFLERQGSEGAPHVEPGSGASARRRRKKNKPPEKNIKACKAYREREKRKRAMLEEANEQLEKERSMYLKRIAELQQQAQVMRGGGHVDLSMENELLRAEIRKHKAFIENVISMADDETTSIEAARHVLRQGIEAGVGQTVGLGITSASDPNWQEGQPIRVGEHHLPVKFVYLPAGVPRSKATRLNIRIELKDFPLNMQRFNERTMYLYSNTEHLNRMYESFRQEAACERRVQPVFPQDVSNLDQNRTGTEGSTSAGASEPQDIRVIRLVSSKASGGPTTGVDGDHEAIYITSYKSTKVHPSALWHNWPSFRGQDAAVEALVSVQTSSSSKVLAPVGAGAAPSRLESQQLLGTIIMPKEGDQERCHVVVVGSYPIGDLGYVGISGKQVPSFDEEGRMDSKYEAKIDRQFRMAFLGEASAPR